MKFTDALVLVAVLFADYGVEAQKKFTYRKAVCKVEPSPDSPNSDELPEGMTIFWQKVLKDKEERQD